MVHIACNSEGLIPEALTETAEHLKKQGRRVKFPYPIPNFNNPSGCWLVEDNPYGLLALDSGPLPAMRSLELNASTMLPRGVGKHGALPPVEISPASGVYDHESRYTAGATRFLTPGELPNDVLEAAGDLAIRTHWVLGHRDISRTGMIVREGVPVFLESNVAPGLTDTSLTPLALEAVGLDMGEVFSALVERARHRGH